MSLLTEMADYDEPGSWGRMSDGWPEIRGDIAFEMYVFANKSKSIPYGAWVLIDRRGEYGASESKLRVHPAFVEKLRRDFESSAKAEQPKGGA